MNRMNQTLAYYEQNADSFVQGTVLADMGDARSRFLRWVPDNAYLLDFGCGIGRDTKAFLELGYRVDAVDGSEELCRRATEYTGIQVRHLLFQELSACQTYDGIWACASLLHVPKAELLDILQKTAAALKPAGILYASFKYGTYEGMRNGRYFSDFTEETMTALMGQVPELQVMETWITEDVRPGREERWINILARRA